MSDAVTPEQLAEIQARADAATRRPWVAAGVVPDTGGYFHVYGPEGILAEDVQRFDADFIAHAREDVPRLIAALRAAADQLAAYSQPLFPSFQTEEWYLNALRLGNIPEPMIHTLVEQRDYSGRALLEAEKRAKLAEAKLDAVKAQVEAVRDEAYRAKRDLIVAGMLDAVLDAILADKQGN